MKRPTRNAVLLFVGEVITRLFGFLAAALLARRLGIDRFGQIGFAMSVMAYGVIVTKFGLLTIGVRDSAQDRGSIPHLAGNILAMRIVLSLVAVIGIVIFAALVPKPVEVKWLMAVFALGVVAQSLLLEWVFTGTERMEYVAAAHVLTNGVYFGLVVLFVRGPGQLLVVPIAFAAGTLAAAALLAVRYAREFGLPRLRLERDTWRYLALRSWPVGIASVLTQVYVNFGIIGLALLRNDHEAGLFVAAHRLVFFLLILDRVFQAVFLPAVSRYYRTQPERLPEVTSVALRVIAASSLPVCTGLSLLARPALVFVFGPGYGPATASLAVLCWFLPLSLLTTLAGYSLLASGQERRFALNTAIGVGLALVALVAGIGLWGLAAAAAAMLLGEVAMLVLMGRDFLRFCRPAVTGRVLVPVAGSVVMVPILLLLRNWSWPLAALAAGVAYLAILLTAGGLTLRDLGLVKQ